MEAMFCLVLATVAIAVLPFRRVGLLAASPVRRAEPAQASVYSELRRVRWAVLACAKRVPWSALCFQQGLAAQIMLRRRGVPSTLYYGAAMKESRRLYAHVWVLYGNENVIGGESASEFALLATFPSKSID